MNAQSRLFNFLNNLSRFVIASVNSLSNHSWKLCFILLTLIGAIDHNHNFMNELIIGLSNFTKVLIVKKTDTSCSTLE